MDVREVRPSDVSAIERVARTSLLASYVPPLSEGIVDDAVEAWYDRDAMTAALDDPTTVYLAAVETDDDGEERLLGFSQSSVVEGGVGILHWLHVDPEARGEGVGDELFARTREALDAAGADAVRGLVLAGNDDGIAFYEDRGFERREERTVEVEGEPHVEYVYELGEVVTVPLTPVVIADGRTVFVAPDEVERGKDGDFHAVYTDRDRSRRYGWYCSNCDSTDTAMDSMGRIECTECGNRHKATRWDAAYL